MAELTQAERFAQAAKAESGSVKRPLKWRLARLGMLIVSGYLLICLALWALQKRIIYNPAVSADLAVESFGFAPRQAQDIFTTTSDGVNLRGWRVLAISNRGQLRDARFVVLFFTGKGGNRSWHDAKFRRLAALGGDVVCFDYRGYGDSEGKPDEEGLARDAHAGWDYLIKEGVKPDAILLYGESLGSAVATRLTAELSTQKIVPAGLIIEGGFPRLADPAQHQFFWVPANLILNQFFPSIERIPQVQCPLLMLHGSKDNVVTVAMGRTLFAAAPASANGIDKTFVEFTNSGHVNLDTAEPDLYQSTLRDFLHRALKMKDHAPEKREKHAPDYKHAVKPK